MIVCSNRTSNELYGSLISSIRNVASGMITLRPVKLYRPANADWIAPFLCANSSMTESYKESLDPAYRY